MTKSEVNKLIEEMKDLQPHEVGDYLENLRQRISPQDFEAIERAILLASSIV